MASSMSSVSLDGHDKQYGPYSTADEAEIMAARMGAICRGVFHQQVAIGVVPRWRHAAAGGKAPGLIWRIPPMGEVIDLRGQSAHLEDDELIENLARFADGTLSEAAVKARHHLTNEDWAAMGENDRLVELVEAAKLRRIRTGATKRERAQIEIVDGPPILGKNHARPQRQRTAQDRFDQNT